MSSHHVALVSESKSIRLADVTRVSAALQIQAQRDLEPVWRVDAAVATFGKLEEVPLGYWPIIIMDDIGTPGAAGMHQDKNGQPFALVMAADDWSLSASHECLEMLVDPYGNRLSAAPSIMPGQGRVQYLVEVADPCETAECGYRIDDVLVSDFYTPAYLRSRPAAGSAFSFNGTLTSARQVLTGGYLSWHDPTTDHWWQQTNFDGQANFRDLGVLTGHVRSLREAIDRLTPEYPEKSKTATRGSAPSPATVANMANASALRSQIQHLLKPAT